MAIIIGFGHRSRMGKDTAAGFTVGYIRQTKKKVLCVKKAFASKMKSMTHELYAWAGLQDEAFYEQEENAHLRNTILPAIGKTPVEIWIEFGTSVGRAIYKDTWLRYVTEFPCDYMIVSDVRFPNEADYIIDNGGYVFKIHNPSVEFRNSVADKALDYYSNWSDIIINDKGLRELNDAVVSRLKGIV